MLMSEFPHLLLEVAKSLYETGGFSEALRFYEPLFELPDYLEPSALVTIGKCYLEVGNKRQAEECFSAAIDAEEDDDDDALIEARFELAQIYEAAREEEEAYILVNEAMRIQEARDEEAEHDLYSDDAGDDEALEDADDAEMEEISRRRARRKQLRRLKQVRDKVKASGPRAPRKPGSGKKRRRVFAASEDTEKEERARAANFAHAWQTVRACRAQADPDARGPSEELMAAAKTLFEDFRSYKNFYTWDVYCRHMGVNREEKGIRSTNPRLLELAERLTHSESTHLESKNPDRSLARPPANPASRSRGTTAQRRQADRRQVRVGVPRGSLQRMARSDPRVRHGPGAQRQGTGRHQGVQAGQGLAGVYKFQGGPLPDIRDDGW